MLLTRLPLSIATAFDLHVLVGFGDLEEISLGWLLRTEYVL